jgi:hypothetical protein
MKVKSALLTQMSGSIGGMTGSHNRGGMYLRARSIPTNPNTTRQQDARAAFTGAVNRWTEVLTSGQRAAWTAYAAQTPTLDSLGDQLILTGQQMYIRSQQVLGRVNLFGELTLTDLTTAPVMNNLGDYTPVVMAWTTGNSATIAYDNTDDWAGETGSVLVIQGSADPVNVTINYYDGPWQMLGNVEGDDTTPPTSPKTITYQNWGVGQKQYARVRVLRVDGRLSSPQVVSATRTA